MLNCSSSVLPVTTVLATAGLKVGYRRIASLSSELPAPGCSQPVARGRGRMGGPESNHCIFVRWYNYITINEKF